MIDISLIFELLQTRSFCVMARVERTDFLLPMYVGELAHLSAKITYCSQHSLEVKVFVEAENIFSGTYNYTIQKFSVSDQFRF